MSSKCSWTVWGWTDELILRFGLEGGLDNTGVEGIGVETVDCVRERAAARMAHSGGWGWVPAASMARPAAPCAPECW